MIKYQFENAKNICMLDKLVIFSWFFFQDDSNWADWGNDTPASNFDIDADEKKRQREEKLLLLKEQKETELKIQSLLQYIADLAASSSSSTSV